MTLRATTVVLAFAASTGSLTLASSAIAQEERSPIVRGETPLPFAYNYGDVDTTRSGAFSGALRATGYGTTAVYLNPALMTFSKVYHIEAWGTVTPEYGRMVFGSTVVDSVTSKLAGGTSVSGGFLDSFSDKATSVDRTWVDVRLALAYPIVDEFSVGLAGRYIKLNQAGTGPLGASKVSGGQQDPEGDGRLDIVNIPTFDAGIAIKAGDLVRIGLSGQNLTYMNNGILPTIVGGGVGLAHPSFTVEVDCVADLTSYENPTARLMAGGEYLIKDMVPIRVGYRWDQGADSHQISGGLGYNSPEFKIEASFRRTLVGPEMTEILFAAAYHLDSSGIAGGGQEF